MSSASYGFAIISTENNNDVLKQIEGKSVGMTPTLFVMRQFLHIEDQQ